MNDTVKANEEKIATLQNKMHILQPNSSKTSTAMTAEKQHDLITELQERSERSKNIVIIGIPEQYSEKKEERQMNDRLKIDEVLKLIYPECPKPQKIFRLGKYNAKRSRPLKVCFDSQIIAKTILRNKVNFKEENFRIYSDQTPQQREFLIHIKNELKQRQNAGEDNLIIKYIKGVPKIISKPSKN